MRLKLDKVVRWNLQIIGSKRQYLKRSSLTGTSSPSKAFVFLVTWFMEFFPPKIGSEVEKKKEEKKNRKKKKEKKRRNEEKKKKKRKKKKTINFF